MQEIPTNMIQTRNSQVYQLGTESLVNKRTREANSCGADVRRDFLIGEVAEDKSGSMSNTPPEHFTPSGLVIPSVRGFPHVAFSHHARFPSRCSDFVILLDFHRAQSS
jgi:hypothetical protein